MDSRVAAHEHQHSRRHRIVCVTFVHIQPTAPNYIRTQNKEKNYTYVLFHIRNKCAKTIVRECC